MNTRLLILMLAGVLAPCALAAAPGTGEDGQRDPMPVLDKVTTRPAQHVSAVQIVDCHAKRLPRSVEVGRYIDASSFAESDRAVLKMKRDVRNACERVEKVRLVFLAPNPKGARQTASVRIEAAP